MVSFLNRVDPGCSNWLTFSAQIVAKTTRFAISPGFRLAGVPVGWSLPVAHVDLPASLLSVDAGQALVKQEHR